MSSLALLVQIAGSSSWCLWTQGPTVLAAAEIGLSAETLCACGASSVQVEALLNTIRAASQERFAIASTRSAVASAARVLVVIEAQLASDPLNQSLRSQRAAAESALSTAKDAHEHAKTTRRQSAMNDLGPSQSEALFRLIRNGSMRAPLAIKVGAWTPLMSKRIEAALIAEQRSLAAIASMPEGAANLLAEVRADPAVVAAAQSLSTNLSAIRAVFEACQN